MLKTLVTMGYRGADGQARHISGTGDGGVDGVIDQEELGLQRIDVQAKRCTADNALSRKAIQAFVVALHGRAARGPGLADTLRTLDADGGQLGSRASVLSSTTRGR